MPVNQKVIDLLAVRRRTNGYATIEELAEADGIDINAPYSAEEVRELDEQLRRDTRIAVQQPIGINEATQYRLLAYMGTP